MKNKPSKAWDRKDVREYWEQHNYDIESIIDELRSELITRTVHFQPPVLSIRHDKANGKIREIAIEHIKEQYYDYIAYRGLDDLQVMVGEYQIACTPGKGPILGARVIKGWMQDDSIRYAIKADVRQCYPSITHDNMMSFLRKRVKNDTLLYLIEQLLRTSPTHGLPIGSYLSIRLCALYLSQLYHHIGGSYFRRGKNVVHHVLFFLDDLYILGTNAKAMHKAMRGIIVYADSIGLTIKPDWRLLNLNPSDKHAHIDAMGYRIYRDHITMRRRDYVKTKRAFRCFQKCPCYETATSAAAYHGLFVKVTDSYRFRKKYQIKKLFRKARKEISRHDKSRFFRETGSCQSIRTHAYADPVPALCA